MKKGTKLQVVAKIKSILRNYKLAYANKFENLDDVNEVLDKIQLNQNHLRKIKA